MKPIGWALAAALFYVAAVCDQAASAGQLFGASGPDCLTVVALVVAVLTRPAIGAAAGFIAGLFAGAIVGANLAHWIITRTLAGFFVSIAVKIRIEVNTFVACLSVFLGVLGARVAYLLLTAPPGLGPLLGQGVISALASGLLALPVYALLSRTVAAERT